LKDDSNHTPETREQFLTARQLAVVLQISESTVRRLAREGRIPSIRITPRILRFHLQSVRDKLDDANKERSTRLRRHANEPQPDDSQLSLIDIL
jgi:excisionase family DNA binding protein